MINIQIRYKGNDIVEVDCKGHSGFAKRGSDIVCSAVSAIVQTALLGLIDISVKEVEYTRKDGDLVFKCPTTSDSTEGIKQQTILRTMLLGLRDMENGYKAFIKLEEQQNVY